MPAPNRELKSSTVAPQKRVTRNSIITRASIENAPKGKSNVATLKKKESVIPKCENSQDVLSKRKAEKSPYTNKCLKRSAFVDISNAVNEKSDGNTKKILKKPNVLPPSSKLTNRTTAKTTTVKPLTTSTTSSAIVLKKKAVVCLQPIDKTKENVDKHVIPKKKTVTVAPVIKKPSVATVSTVTVSPVIPKQPTAPQSRPVTRQSIRLSDVAASSDQSSLLNLSDDVKSEIKESPKPPPDVEDFDKENWNDPYQISHYAYDIFCYLKSREVYYKIPDYIEKQTSITKGMRSLLVDWMIDVQENFALTHETLYLAVKIVDKYLSKVIINRDTLQLVGATAIFIASKFDERSPPPLDDIVYIGDQAYTEDNVIIIEREILRVLGFDLGFPLSYRFLRRYARCSKASMELLTLARFILEYCLMDYFVVTASDSKMAAAALHIARMMKNEGTWNATLEYYSGYKLDEFKDIAFIMNDIMHKKPRNSLATVRNKYSSETFLAVAKIPLVNNEVL